ncbi:hypothetical protein U8P71_17225 [Rhizobium ruizarguesonis]|nr:hypothetical protein U8P71_17225 [Rhizobium ruizarguesonis]
MRFAMLVSTCFVVVWFPLVATCADLIEPNVQEQAFGDITELHQLREDQRSKSPLVTHQYDKAGFSAYLRTLNDQVVTMETLSLLLNSYAQLHVRTMNRIQYLQACLKVNKKGMKQEFDVLCSGHEASNEQLKHDYYSFRDAAAAVVEHDNGDLATRSIAPLISDLSRLYDSSIETEAELVALTSSK